MLKILHTADWHLGKRLQEYSRLEEQTLVLDEICKIADQENVDLVLLAGDIFDTFNPAHEAVELLYKTLRRLSKNGTRPILAISGNHDSTQFVEAPDPLARELGIFFYSRYDSVIPCGKLDSGIEILKSESGFLELKLPQAEFPVRVILAPYANEVSLRTYLGEENREAEFRKLLSSKWQDLADRNCDEKGLNLFLGHFFFMKEGEKAEAEPESESLPGASRKPSTRPATAAVPSRPMVPLRVCSAAGLIAGTVPTIGISSTSRTMPKAMVLAVLQAMQARRG